MSRTILTGCVARARGAAVEDDIAQVGPHTATP